MQDIYYINKKVGRVALWVIIAIAVVLILVSLIPKRLYFTCTELRKEGHVYIDTGSKYYSAALDRDHDGFACE